MTKVMFVYLIFILSEIVTSSFACEDKKQKVGAGDPLILTPLIEDNRTEEARIMSKVNLGNIESYSGYLTVNKQFDSNLFFWFFPAKTVSPKSNLLLWIDGGAGRSTIFSIFTENGPFEMISPYEFKYRSKSWNDFNHILYIDSPVGTGFSYTKGGYSENATQVAKELYIALLQFFKLFPEYKENRFFIAGRWLAGKYLPKLANIIDAKNKFNRNNKRGEEIINLKGLIMGNALSDPEKQIKYGEYLYQLGFINSTGKKLFMNKELSFRRKIWMGQYDKAYYLFDEMITSSDSMFVCYTKLYNRYYNYNYRFEYFSGLEFNVERFMKSEAVRSAIHVGKNDFARVNLVLGYIKNDIMNSVAHVVLKLLEKYKIYYYNGHSNIVINYRGTIEYIDSLKYINKKTERQFDERFGVYSLKYRNLGVDLVIGAGLVTTFDKPNYMYEKIQNL